MARTAKPRIQKIEPGTPEMEAFLSVGYGGMSVATAQKIIAERDKDPHLWPFEEYQKAKAFLEAYNAKPQVISQTPGWKRTRGG
jgi:hypothetical protein